MGFDEEDLLDERAADPFEELPQEELLPQIYEDQPDDEPTAVRCDPSRNSYWRVTKTVGEWCASATVGHFSGGGF